MQFPLSISDVSLWIAFMAIVLLITSELLLSYSGRTSFPIDKRRLRLAALILGLAAMFTVLLRVIAPI